MNDQTKYTQDYNKDSVLGFDDLGFSFVDVPQWEINACVRMLTAEEKDNYQNWVVRNPGADNQKIILKGSTTMLVAMCLVHPETKKPIFDYTNKDDLKRLGRKSAAAQQIIFDEALSLNKMTEEDLKELQENLDETQD